MLNNAGWLKANELFVRPSPSPRGNTILVTSKRGALEERPAKGNRAEGYQWGIYSLGRIDSKLRFEPSPKTKSDWAVYVYSMVLTDKHWESGPDGQPTKEVTGVAEWRFDGTQSVRWATSEAAIRYVTEMRDRASDPVVKQNADRTIAILKRNLSQK